MMKDYPESVFDAGNSVYQGAKSAVGKSVSYIKSTTNNSISAIADYAGKNVPTVTIVKPKTTSEKLVDGLQENKHRLAFTAAVLMFAYGVLKSYAPSFRRANKLSNGLRYEVLLLIGSPHSPVVSKLISDLNVRGFIVYVTVTNEAELKTIEQEQDQDIRPFFINYSNEQNSIRDEFIKFCNYLDVPTENDVHLLFKGAIFIPEWNKFPKGDLEDITNSSEIQRVVNDKCLNLSNVLNNGLSSLLRASNQCKQDIEKYNHIKHSGKHTYTESGDSKLIIVNFIPIKDYLTTKRKNNKAILDLALGFQKIYYDQLYQRNRKFRSNGIGIFGMTLKSNSNPEASKYINMTMLNVSYHRGGVSMGSSQFLDTVDTNESGRQYQNESFFTGLYYKVKMIFHSFISRYFFSSEYYYGINRPFSSKVLNYKVFDLLYAKGEMGKIHTLSNKPAFI